MSLFVCSKCGCIDNTATSYYWALIRPCKNRIYDKSLKGYEGKPLCSECAAIEYDKEDKLHKISRYIVNFCRSNNIGTIIIGLNKEWK